MLFSSAEWVIFHYNDEASRGLLSVITNVSCDEARAFLVGSEFVIRDMLGELPKYVLVTMVNATFLRELPTSLTRVVTAKICRTDSSTTENRRKHAGLHSTQPQYPPSIPPKGISAIGDSCDLSVYLTGLTSCPLTTTVHSTA